MHLTFASYNIHKAVGLDRRRDPERILAVLREIDADVIALQEADRRFGDRTSVIPRQALADYTPWQAVPLTTRPDSIGWHGNALLVRRGIAIVDSAVIPCCWAISTKGHGSADALANSRLVTGRSSRQGAAFPAAGRSPCSTGSWHQGSGTAPATACTTARWRAAPRTICPFTPAWHCLKFRHAAQDSSASLHATRDGMNAVFMTRKGIRPNHELAHPLL